MAYADEYNKMATDFLAKHDATMTIEFRDVVDMWGGIRNAYDVTIERNGDSFMVDFKDSVANYRSDKEPTEYDILACLEKYGYDSYKDFCEEFGYLGSEETLEQYRAIMDEYDNVIGLFGDCMDELREIA